MPQGAAVVRSSRLCPLKLFEASHLHDDIPNQHSKSADQARHAVLFDIRSDAFRVGVLGAEIGLIRLRQGYGGQRLA